MGDILCHLFFFVQTKRNKPTPRPHRKRGRRQRPARTSHHESCCDTKKGSGWILPCAHIGRSTRFGETALEAHPFPIQSMSKANLEVVVFQLGLCERDHGWDGAPSCCQGTAPAPIAFQPVWLNLPPVLHLSDRCTFADWRQTQQGLLSPQTRYKTVPLSVALLDSR